MVAGKWKLRNGSVVEIEAVPGPTSLQLGTESIHEVCWQGKTVKRTMALSTSEERRLAQLELWSRDTKHGLTRAEKEEYEWLKAKQKLPRK